MEDHVEKFRQADALAQNILRLTRNTLLVNLLFLVIGMLMEANAAVVMMTPILLPLVKSMGVDPIHFGMIMVLGAQIGMITPPVGVNLFVASGISGLSLEKMSKGIIPFVLLMCGLFVLIIHLYPRTLLIRAGVSVSVRGGGICRIPDTRTEIVRT